MSKLFFLVIGLNAVWALPQSPVICEGQVNCLPTSDGMEIRTSDRAIIEWKEFSIESNERIQIVQPHIASSLLNRVTDPHPSRLFGRLEANGQVILINPNGVLVGAGAEINTGSFIASSLDIQNQCFLAAKELQFMGESRASIENLGSLSASNGDLLLIGQKIDLVGAMHGQNGMIGIIASSGEVTIRQEGTDRLYIRSQNNATKVSNQGSIFCKHSDGAGGTVALLGDHIWLKSGSLIDVSNDLGMGTVLIGGDYQGQNSNLPHAQYVYFEKGAKILANSRGELGGGKVILWSDGMNGSFGSISALGKGFVEVSGQYLDFQGDVHTGGGTLLLDPFDITISTAGNTPAFFTPFGPTLYTSSGGACGVSTGAILTPATLIAALAANDVIVQTGAGGACPGNIFIINNVIYGSTHHLTFSATNNITVGSAAATVEVQNSGTGNITLTSTNPGATVLLQGAGVAGVTFTSVGSRAGITTVNVPNGTLSLLGGTASDTDVRLGSTNGGGSSTGAINVTCGALNLTAGTALDTYVAIGHGTRGSSAQLYSGDINVLVTNGDANLTGTASATSGSGAFIGHGIVFVAGNNTSALTTGNINVAVNGNLNLINQSTAVGGPNNDGAHIGHTNGQMTTAGASITGNINVNVAGNILLSSLSGSVSNARIGHSVVTTNVGFGSYNGDISVCCGGNINMETDLIFTNGSSRDACIGHGTIIADGTGNNYLTSVSGRIDILCEGNLTMTHFGGGTTNVRGNGVYIGHWQWPRTVAPLNPYNMIGCHYRISVAGDTLIRCLDGGFQAFIGMGASNHVQNMDASLQMDNGGNLTLITQNTSAGFAIGGVFTFPINSGSGIGFYNVFPTLTTTTVYPQTSLAVGGSILLDNQGLRGCVIGSYGDTNVAAGNDITLQFTPGTNVQTEGNFIGSFLGGPAQTPVIATTRVFAASNILCANGNANCGRSFIGRNYRGNITGCPFALSQTFDTPVVIRASGDIQMANSLSLNSGTTTAGIFIEADTNFATGELWSNGGGALSTICAQPLTSPIPNTNACGQFVVDPFTSSSPPIASNCIGGYRTDTGPVNAPITYTSPFGPITINSGEFQTTSIPQNITLGTAPNEVLLSTNIGDITISGPTSCCSFQNITVDTAVTTSGSILMIANHNMSLTAAADITSTASSATLVVDNSFCSRPLIGPGAFIMDIGAVVNSGVGQPLRIYTALQGQNAILGLLNGFNFLAGTLYSDTATEQWCTYYPEFTPGFPFTVSYKDCLQLATQQAMIIVDQFLIDLHPFNEFPGWVNRFFFYYTLNKSNIALTDEPYYIRRRNLNIINHPKSYTVLLNDEIQ